MALADLVPVGGEDGAAALLKRLVHRTSERFKYSGDLNNGLLLVRYSGHDLILVKGVICTLNLRIVIFRGLFLFLETFCI